MENNAPEELSERTKLEFALSEDLQRVLQAHTDKWEADDQWDDVHGRMLVDVMGGVCASVVHETFKPDDRPDVLDAIHERAVAVQGWLLNDSNNIVRPNTD